MSELVTGEAVALDLRLAALPSRVVAYGIDAALQVLVLVVVGVLVGVSSLELSDAAGAALGVVLAVLVLVVFPVAAETLTRGRSPGKAAMGLRVVRDDGGPIGFRQALVRGLAGAFLERFGITFYVLAVVVMLSSARDKRVGDLLAGTVVVQERVPASAGAVVAMPPPLAAWAATLDLSRLTDALTLSARQFLARADALTPQAREDLGGRLVAAVAAATSPPPPAGTPGWAFLSAVLAERSRREGVRLRGGVADPPAPPVTAPPPAPLPEPTATPPPPRTGGFAPPS